MPQFTIEPKLIQYLTEESGKTLDLIANFNPHGLYLELVDVLNERFHFCQIIKISDTQTRFKYNAGLNSEEIQCVLYFVFVLVFQYEAQLKTAWQSGLDQIMKAIADLRFPDSPIIEDNQKNRTLVNLMMKRLIIKFLKYPRMIDKYDLKKALEDLSQVEDAMKEIISLENGSIIDKLHYYDDIKMAKKYLEKIQEKQREIEMILSEIIEKYTRLNSFFDSSETFSNANYEEILPMLKSLSRPNPIKSLDIYMDAHSLATRHHIDLPFII